MNPSTDVSQRNAGGSFDLLRRLFRQPRGPQRCDVCGSDLGPDHEHLVLLRERRILCSCQACAILAPASQERMYGRITRNVQFLPTLRMSEQQWDRFQIPINLAFFFYNSMIGKVSAGYPSPAGLIETLADQDAWAALVADNPLLQHMKPDVEALLVNRVGADPEYFLLPMDHCYRLIGLMRVSWHGLSGGKEAQAEIDAFFSKLKEHAHARPPVPH